MLGKINKEWGKENKLWETAIASIGASVGSYIKKMVDTIRARNSSYGTLGGQFADIGFVGIDQSKFSDAGTTLGKQLTESIEKKDSVTGEATRELGGKQSLKVAVKFAGTRTAAGEPFAQSLEISVSRLREISFGDTVGGLGGKAKVETGEKLARFKVGWLGLFHDGKMGGNFLGAGNLGNQSRGIRESEV